MLPFIRGITLAPSSTKRTPMKWIALLTPFDKEPAGRIRQGLGDAGGLTQFGVNRLQLPPGAWSGRRHWHTEGSNAF